MYLIMNCRFISFPKYIPTYVYYYIIIFYDNNNNNNYNNNHDIFVMNIRTYVCDSLLL